MESSSQSLFQVYYLSAVEVDRRCGSSVLPWIIEELKLRLETAQDMQLLWITLGPEDIAYVADTGMELQHHPYNDIVRCTTGQDNVSFAYIIHSEKDSRSFCHVFQSLIPDEAAVISFRLKHHGICMDNKIEPPVLPGNRLVSMVRQSKKAHKFTTGRSLSSRRNSIDPSTDTIFPVTFYGSMPYKSKPLQAETVDKYVKCLSASNRPSSAEKYTKKWQRKKRSTTFTSPKTNGMFRLQSFGSDDVDYEENDDDLDDIEPGLGSKSLSDLDCIETSINLTPGSPSHSPIVPSSHTSGEDMAASLDTPDENRRNRSDSIGRKLHDSVSKRRPWSFRNIKKTSSLGGINKTHMSKEGDDSPHSYHESGSLNGSVSSLNKVDGDSKATPPPSRSDTAPAKATPTPAVKVNDLDSSGEDEDMEETNSVNEPEDGHHSDKESHGSDTHFDMVQDLDEMAQDPEFSLLGIDGNPRVVRQHLSSIVSAHLTISGTKMTVTGIKRMGSSDHLMDEDQDENARGFANLDYKPVLLVEATVIQVLCCSQGQQCPEYVAFVTRQKGTKSCKFHLIRASNDKDATGIVKAFKYAFEYNMVLQIPTYLCETCPVKHLNAICKELNKRTPQESLLQLKDIIIAAASESDYNSIAKDYKKQPFENEHNQVIRWATLMREHFNQKQNSHGHHSAEKSKPTKIRPSTASKSRFLHIGKLGESYENLKDVRIEDKKTNNNNSDVNSSTTNIHSSESSIAERLSSPLTMASAAILESQFSDIPEQDKTVSAYSHEFSKYRSMFPTSNSFPPPSLKDSPSSTNEQSPDFGSPSKNGDLPNTRGHRRSMSWRQQIFESVTPSKQTDLSRRRASLTEMVMETPLNQKIGYSASISENPEYSPSNKAKNRWKWAIQQQILLLKLEKENQSVLNEEIRWRRLNYKDPSIDSLVIGRVWSELLEKNSQSHEELFAAVKMGVPPKMREKVWQLLVSHYHYQHPGEVPMGNYPSSVEAVEFEAYRSLTTEYESVIVADIDRTFPTHPYFMDKEGQKALHGVLHAYAVSDTECGYCQGLSFVAGIVLMHSANDVETFVTLNHLMFLYGFREIYSKNMFVLQTKLYQFSRLLHDQQPNVHAHLEENDVSPFLYAAPWFLTIFSSQFPIPFVARVFDLVFFEGLEAIYKVSLSLIKHYQYDILQLDNMETITSFLKSEIPERVSHDSSEILHSASQIGDLSSKLKTFETEYLVMHELMSTFHMEKKVAMSDTEATNDLLRKQNKDLIEQVVMCRGAIMRLESAVTMLQNTCTSQQQQLIDQQKRLNRLEKHVMESKPPQHIIEGEIPLSGNINDQSAQIFDSTTTQRQPSPPSLDLSSSDDILSSPSPNTFETGLHPTNNNHCNNNSDPNDLVPNTDHSPVPVPINVNNDSVHSEEVDAFVDKISDSLILNGETVSKDRTED